MNFKFWLRLFGAALLLHVVLIALSILEVFLYSTFVTPGGDQAFYSQHAEKSGPWISGIFGSIFIFLIVRRVIRKNTEKALTYALALPLIYIAIDFALLAALEADWATHLLISVAANGAKMLSALFAYYIYRPSS